VILFYSLGNLSISYKEAQVVFEEHDFLHHFTTFFLNIFGYNDIALRLPFLVLHLFNIFLLYKISKIFLKKKSDRVWAVLIYSILPGVNGGAILVNSATIVISITLIFVYLQLIKQSELSYMVLISAFVVDNSFFIFYFALLFYAMGKKENVLLGISLLMFVLSLYFGGIDLSGKPRGHFLEIIGLYAAIFSPFVFLFFVYSLYRILIKEEKNILWYVSFTALIVSFFLSFRQKIRIEDFAPFVVISVPFMVKIFFVSYRIRLPINRRFYTVTLYLIITSLLFSFFTAHFNKTLYHFLDRPKEHFAYEYHYAKELAAQLKEENIDHVSSSDHKLLLRLQFYGIKGGEKYRIEQEPGDDFLYNLKINYTKNLSEHFFVSKIHSN
jgi:hypothetical protein